MPTRRSFIGVTLAAISGCFAGVPKLLGKPEPVYRPACKFGHWDAALDVCAHGDIRVDGIPLAVVEANDIEGWAIIDIADLSYGGISFHGNWPQAKVFGHITIQPGVMGSAKYCDERWLSEKQDIILHKMGTTFLLPTRTEDWPGCKAFPYEIFSRAVISHDPKRYNRA